MPTQYFPPFFPYTDYLQSTVYEADGVTSTIPFSFGYVGKADFTGSSPSPYIKVYHLNPVTEEYSEVGFTMPSSSSITISDALKSSGYYMIRSDHSLAARLVDYESGATASEQTLDLDSNQAWYLIREHYDRLLDVLYTAQSSNFDGPIFEFAGNGSDSSWRLTNASWTIDELVSEAAVDILVNGAGVQVNDFSLSQDTDGVVVLTLDRTPETGEHVQVKVAPTKAIAPSLADGSIDSEQLADGAINDLDLFDLDSEGTARYVLGWNGSTTFGAYQLDADWIDSFNASVIARRLDQFAAPTASISMNSNKITSLTTPTSDFDAANKKYVDDQLAANGAGSSARFNVNTYRTSFPYTVASGLDEGIYEVHLRFTGVNNNPGGVYEHVVTVNGESASNTIEDHPDGGDAFQMSLHVEVTGAGTIIINSVSNIRGFHGGCGHKIAAS